MSFLYSITIYPLEALYRLTYDVCVSAASSYGWGLILLSLLTTIIFVPLKALAAGAQLKEKNVRKILDPQIKAIKAESGGAAAHERLSALYKRYGYHPIYAIRSALGAFLQVPFLIAAYQMLSHFAPLAGADFGPVDDLSLPDGLLGGLNALPLIMTLFNLGALYASPGFSRRDHIQGIIVALLFLALLYPAPSALLIYWTGNNAILFLQNIFHKRRQAKPTNNNASRNLRS